MAMPFAYKRQMILAGLSQLPYPFSGAGAFPRSSEACREIDILDGIAAGELEPSAEQRHRGGMTHLIVDAPFTIDMEASDGG